MKLTSCVGLLLVLAFARADKVFRVEFKDKLLFSTYVEKRNLDIWSIRNGSADVAVSQKDEEELQTLFKADVIVPDVEKAAESEMEENEKVGDFIRRFRIDAAPINNFERYDVITKWMEKMAREKNFVSIRSIGRTHEGRDMKMLRIGSGPETKPAVMVMGGIHAREWLSVATVVYFMNKLVTDTESRVKNLLAKYDFYIIPVSNPDGYEYTFKSRWTRSWRKTRRPQANGCYGADPNRNFDVYFGQKSASPDPCHIIYPGPYAFSEKCTTNLKNFALSDSIKGRIKLFYDVHAYSQMYFVPYAFDKRYKPQDDTEMRRVATISNDALQRVNGRRFLLGTPGEILYDASGSTMDWFKLRAGVKYAFAFEVFPDMYSRIGFLARPSDIKPSGEEISEAILTAAENIKV